VKFKKNDVVFEVRDTAHIAAFRAAGWQELTEPKQEKTEEILPDINVGDMKNVENSVETVETAKNAKPKRAKA
jgi:hypothetical protein